VREELARKKQNEIDREVQVQIMEEIFERNPFELPRSMVERELQRMLDTIRYRLSSQNLTLEQAGMDEDAFRERNREAAEKKVRQSILLDKIAVQERFEISEEELDRGLHEVAEEGKQPYEKVRNFYQKHELIEPYRQQLLEEKVMKFLRDQAEITEVDAKATESVEEKAN